MMKNIKRLLVATMSLMAASSMANLLQPITPVNEDTPVRLNIGLESGLNGTPDGFGLTNLGGGIGITHSIGYDFEYGLAATGNWATAEYGRKIWTPNGKDSSGFRLGVDAMARYMAEMAERLRAGVVLDVGYGHQFSGADYINKGRSFGDLYVKAGPAISYGFSNAVSAYLAVKYSIHNIRFGVTDEKVKKYANLMGMDVPVGLWFGLADSAGLFIEANNRFLSFKDFGRSYRMEATLGVSYAL